MATIDAPDIVTFLEYVRNSGFLTSYQTFLGIDPESHRKAGEGGNVRLLDLDTKKVKTLVVDSHLATTLLRHGRQELERGGLKGRRLEKCLRSSFPEHSTMFFSISPVYEDRSTQEDSPDNCRMQVAVQLGLMQPHTEKLGECLKVKRFALFGKTPGLLPDGLTNLDALDHYLFSIQDHTTPGQPNTMVSYYISTTSGPGCLTPDMMGPRAIAHVLFDPKNVWNNRQGRDFYHDLHEAMTAIRANISNVYKELPKLISPCYGR